MKLLDLRSRMIFTAILPVTLVSIVLSALFLVARMGDVSEAHSQRERALVRQLATASEFGIFSGNSTHLQNVAKGAMREADVLSVTVLNDRGQILARAGRDGFITTHGLSLQETEQLDLPGHIDLLSQPVLASEFQLDEVFEGHSNAQSPSPRMLGNVVVEFSRHPLIDREKDMLLAGTTITLGGLIFGVVLALAMGRSLARPILRMSHMIERIGQGQLSARTEVEPNDPLRVLQTGLNQMAEHLELGRDQLEYRIAMATLELRAKKEEAELATLAKSRFLAAASHDLRQPTHALGMFVARLAQLPHDAQTREIITQLDASVSATQDLLDALLDISRLDANVVKVNRHAFALADLFNALRDNLNTEAQDRGLRLRVHPTSAWVSSDAALLQRILWNLTVNALRYTRQGGVLIACRVHASRQCVSLEVWDSGIGIAPEHQHDVFNEFFQVANTERDRNKGLGLGLNIVKRTAQLLDHPLQLCSVPGRGTRFRIEVPLASALTAPLAPAAPLELAGQQDFAGRLILVVEDDDLVRAALGSLLTTWGLEVAMAHNLEQARAQVLAHRTPDIIISDYRLPQGENGIAVIQAVRDMCNQPIRACLLSGNTDSALMQLAQEAALSLLHKPVRPAKLRSLLHHLFASEARALDNG